MRTLGDIGAAPVTITRTRPPRDAYRREGVGWGKVYIEQITSWAVFPGADQHLDFVEDEFVPQAVVPDDAFLHLGVLPVHGKVQQPLLEGAFGAALNLFGRSSEVKIGWSVSSVKRDAALTLS